jgi:hypothetical protein
MMLFFRAKLEELRLSALEFFETAYVWKFDKQPVVQEDFCQYLLHGVLPKYVVEYLKHLQQGERK